MEPNNEQRRHLNRFAGITRAFRNNLLERINKEYDRTRKYPDLSWKTAQCAAMKNDPALFWLKIAPSQALQCAAIELDLSFQRWFEYLEKINSEEHPKDSAKVRKVGKPQFHKRGRDESFRIPQGGFAATKNPPGFVIDQEKSLIFVPKLGWVKYRNSRDISVYKSWSGGKPKAAVFKRRGGKWFVTVFTEYEGKFPEKAEKIAAPAGIDRGVKRAFQTSRGEYFNFPEEVEKLEKRIRSLESHRDKKCRRPGKDADGKRIKRSRKYRDYSREIGKLQIRAVNMKRDFLHKLTTGLSKAQDLIAVERLEIASMTRSAKGTIDSPGKNVRRKSGLNRSILSRNWGMFLRFLRYKMDELGYWLIEVDPRHTSRTCARCGHVSKNNRKSQEKFVCGACGHADNADHNAAVNILARGMKIFLGRPERSSRDDIPKQTSEAFPSGERFALNLAEAR